VVADKSVSSPVVTSTDALGQTSPTVEPVADDQSASKPLGSSTGNLKQAPSNVERVADDRTVDQLLNTSGGNSGQPSPIEDVREILTSSSIAASAEAAGRPPRTKAAWTIGKWLRLPGALLAERRFASQASRELLDLYTRTKLEEPQLTGKALYERVVIRRSGLDARGAAGVLLRAEESFCDWPSGRDLKFQDVVQYVVIDEYLRSHVANVGTRTNMVNVVARAIPHDV
jgi:hypothetical protein